MHDVMIDLVTLSPRPDAMIRSIGVVAFGPNGLGAELSIVIEPSSAIGHIDPKTVAWWFDQSAAVRNPLGAAYTGNRVPLTLAIQQLTWFLRALDVPPARLRIWSHGSAFVIPIIESAFRACGHMIPWGDRAARDTRTILEFADVKITTLEDAKHDALGDARIQARAVIEAARRLDLRRLWPEVTI